ncbi:MAG: 30S ribosomal protein S27ae [Sulfolobales archaeon]
MAKEKRFRSSLYIIEGNRIRLKNRICPRCGAVMGYYKDGGGERWYCGRCHYTDFIVKKGF